MHGGMMMILWGLGFVFVWIDVLFDGIFGLGVG